MNQPSPFSRITDPVGRKKREVRDGLGRLIRVDEPNDNGNLGTITAPTQPAY
ncbi:MAG: hypothetical protein RMM98_07170 [Acidobacteriota bacterium]|nr:hypothetical protein [Blastocatellia bacterium]MDW8239378.1 hypothetical protein [Acidobacteriota bacterium]